MAAWTDCLYTEGLIKGNPPTADVASIACLEPLFKNLITAVAAFAGVGLFVMLLMGGFTFLTSGGDQKKLEMAQGTITNAIIGLVVMAVGYLILKTIETFTGVPVTKFSVPMN